MHTGRESANIGNFELGEKDRQRHSWENGEMKRRAGGRAQCFRRKRAGGARLAGSGCDRTSGTEGRCGTQNRSDVTWVLDTCKNHEKRSARGNRRAEQFVEC